MMVKDTYAANLKSKLMAAASGDEDRKRVTLYLDPEFYTRFQTFCKEEKVSMNKAAIIAIEMMMEHAE